MDNVFKFATWNVQGLAYKEAQLGNILAKKDISIAAISESIKKET